MNTTSRSDVMPVTGFTPFGTCPSSIVEPTFERSPFTTYGVCVTRASSAAFACITFAPSAASSTISA